MKSALALFGATLLAGGCASTEFSYLDQEVPGSAPALFAPGIVNTDAIELNGVFLPDGSEFFFTRVLDDFPVPVPPAVDYR